MPFHSSCEGEYSFCNVKLNISPSKLQITNVICLLRIERDVGQFPGDVGCGGLLADLRSGGKNKRAAEKAEGPQRQCYRNSALFTVAGSWVQFCRIIAVWSE